MKVLITGAKGFIGQNLISRLSQFSDIKIFALDIKGENKREHLCQTLNTDIAMQGWTEIIPEPMDVVVHLAQSMRYRDFPEGAYDMVKININGTFELLDWCQKNFAKKFIFSSTGNVYKAKRGFLTEEDICEPSSMYASTKLCAEHLVTQYSTFFQTIILRLFGVYGPGQTNMIIPNIIESVYKKKEITLAQKIGLYMTPIYISDCVEMLYKLIIDQKTTCDTFNMSGSEVTHLGDIIKYVEELLNCSANISFSNDEPRYLLGESKKLREALDYNKMVSFKEGMRKILFGV